MPGIHLAINLTLRAWDFWSIKCQIKIYPFYKALFVNEIAQVMRKPLGRDIHYVRVLLSNWNMIFKT